MKFDYLTQKDKYDILFCCKYKVDYVAISFVWDSEDVRVIRNPLNGNGGKNIKIISKIENREGINNIESILTVSDGIMVSRGDLGVEIPYTQLPVIQKKILCLCKKEKIL